MKLQGSVKTVPSTVNQPSAYRYLMLPVPIEPVLNQRRYLHIKL